MNETDKISWWSNNFPHCMEASNSLSKCIHTKYLLRQAARHSIFTVSALHQMCFINETNGTVYCTFTKTDFRLTSLY